MSDLKSGDKPDWKRHGIRIVHSGELDSNTPQTDPFHSAPGKS